MRVIQYFKDHKFSSVIGVGLVLVALIAIPISVNLAQNSQDSRSRASGLNVGTITGYVYFDTNENGKQDSGEGKKDLTGRAATGTFYLFKNGGKIALRAISSSYL